MRFFRKKAELTDGVIDLFPLFVPPADPDLGFGREWIWRITLHGQHSEIGQISYRNGESKGIYYYGHIGYHVDPPYRGHHTAYRACCLIAPQIRLGGKSDVVITCDPDNPASRRTCEKLGCRLESIVDVPESFYEKYEISRIKCRYVWQLSPGKEEL